MLIQILNERKSLFMLMVEATTKCVFHSSNNRIFKIFICGTGMWCHPEEILKRVVALISQK